MGWPDETSTLFVYGSLLDPAHRAEIIGRSIETAPATLRNYERVRRRHYFIRKCPGGFTPGLLLLKLTRQDLDVLDRYEEVPLLYTREKIQVFSGDGANLNCWAYMPTARTIATPCND